MTTSLADPPSIPDFDAARGRGARGDVSFLGVILCFVLSGFAALLYQTAWMRQFSIVFGTSELAIATVLAAYMGGLALGAALAGRFVQRVRRPILVYGLLELGIAIGAVAVPWALKLARSAQVAMIGGQPSPPDAGTLTHTVFYLVCAFVILGVPTAMMGATLPILARQAVHEENQIGRRVGTLYALNTAGAVGGTLVAAFVLLPRLGLGGTIWAGVAVNALVFVLAALLARGAGSLPRESRAVAPVAGKDVLAGAGAARWILPLMAVSGAVSFTYEVLWTRLLSHVLGGTIHAFATMLAAFLLGITLGSAVAAVLARRARSSALGFALAQIGTALLSIYVYLSMDGLPEQVAKLAPSSAIEVRTAVPLILKVLLPATLCIGATFPFALRVLARGNDAGPVAGRVYAWNTVGAILGSIIAGFWLVPALGFAGVAQLAIATNLLLAVAAVFLLPGHGLVARLIPVAVALLVIPAIRLEAVGSRTGLDLPLAPPSDLLSSSPFPTMRLTKPEQERTFEKIGRSASVVLLESDQHTWQLRTNGLPEAGIMPRGISPVGQNQEWLSVFPVLARPTAKEMLMIGFGGGVALERVPPSVESIDVIELEPEVIEASRAIARARAWDPLADPRLNIVLNDARGALALTDKRYGIIVSQPSHPWTAGASHLYTREFMREIDAHLLDDGVFVQWMNGRFVDQELFRTLGATLLSAFPEVRLYRPGPSFLLFLCSRQPLDVEQGIAATGEPMASARDYYADIGFQTLEDVACVLSLDAEGMRKICDGAAVNTDDRNLLAMRSSPTLEGNLREKIDEVLLPLCPLFDPASTLNRDLGTRLDRVYMAARLADLGMVGKARKLALETEDEVRQMLAVGRWTEIGGDKNQARKAFERAHQLDPNHPDAAYAVLVPVLPQLARGEASPEQTALSQRISDPGRAVIEGAIAAEAKDWEAVYRLESRLAQAGPKDFCYHDATRLRAMWRCFSGDPSDPEVGRRLGREALRLADWSLAISPQESTFQVRAVAAVAADDMDALIETCKALLPFIEGERARAVNFQTQQEIRSVLGESVRAMQDMTPSAVLEPKEVARWLEKFEQLSK